MSEDAMSCKHFYRPATCLQCRDEEIARLKKRLSQPTIAPGSNDEWMRLFGVLWYSEEYHKRALSEHSAQMRQEARSGELREMKRSEVGRVARECLAELERRVETRGMAERDARAYAQAYAEETHELVDEVARLRSELGDTLEENARLRRYASLMHFERFAEELKTMSAENRYRRLLCELGDMRALLREHRDRMQEEDGYGPTRCDCDPSVGLTDCLYCRTVAALEEGGE